MKTHITYIISNINKALAFEWIAEYLDKEKFELNFILLNSEDSELECYLTKNNISVERITYRGKRDIPKAIFRTCKIFKKHKTNIVHTHLFDANLVGLFAAWLTQIPKRIYTRHHSTYHHEYFSSAVKYDKMCNYFATDIIAISENVLNVLSELEEVPLAKIHLIHHGFKLDLFNNVSPTNIEALRVKYNINGAPDESPIIGVISRYTEWKGVQFIIPAFKKLLEKHPNAVLILANAGGNYSTEIKKQLERIPKNNYREILFEKDLFSLYKIFDYFVHVPINDHAEAFGQIYVEALAAGIPSVFTISGIACEFISNENNAIVVNYNNSDDIYDALILLLNNKTLLEQIIIQGKADVKNLFELNTMIQKLEKLYLY